MNVAKFSGRPSLYLAITPICFRFELSWGWWVLLIQPGPRAYRLYNGRVIYAGRKL